jgi:alpha-ketoglutarate-dependent taurine dioxygenase
MPHTTSDDDNDFKHIQVKGLHPTFGAEVHGVDFSKPVPEDAFSEIYKTITKVSIIHYFLSFSIVRQQITYPFHALLRLYTRAVVHKNISVSFRDLTLFHP